jgi:hypothetical protein
MQSHRLIVRPGDVVIRPNILIQIHDGEHGPVIRELRTHNRVPTCGLRHIRDLLGYPDPDIPLWGATPRYIAIGTDGTLEDDDDQHLGAEVLRKEISRRYPQDIGLEWYLYITTAEANGYALREVALFTESGFGEGEVWNRSTHPVINKTVAIAVSYRVTWSVANGGA